MNELISVVVPVYKVEPYLERCIRSILAQTYDTLEVILVDDGSPDRCGEICDCLAQEDPRIKVYHKTNGGLSDARNYGVGRANGKYLAFVDADDYISPHYIEYLFELLVKYDADISCCCLEVTTADTSAFGTNAAIPKEQLLTGKKACKKLFGSLYDILVTACGKLYKREVVNQFPFPVGRKHEDEAVTCKYYFAATQVAIGNRCLYAYYQNPNSIMHNQPISINSDAIWAFRHRAEFFEEHNERRLAEIAWNFLLNHLIRDSLANQGRCDPYINGFDNGKSLDIKTKFAVKLYNVSPYIYKKCLKIYCGLYDTTTGLRKMANNRKEG